MESSQSQALCVRVWRDPRKLLNGAVPKEQTDTSFQNISVDQPIICNKKECSALREKNLAFKVLCGVDHAVHVLFERFSLGRIIFFVCK